MKSPFKKHYKPVVLCVCLICGTNFNINNALFARGEGLYCSKECSNVGLIGKHRPNHVLEILRQSHLGKPAWNKGIPRTKEDIEKITQKTREAMHKPEIYQKMIGENHPGWLGGISFEPYCPKFNKEFKERVRKYFNYTCPQCGRSQEENGKALHIHHVNYNKNTCCDKSIPLFVPLCDHCHGKSGHNRTFWEYWFTMMIDRLYNGQCYLPKVTEE